MVNVQQQTLILASSSPRRRDLIRMLPFPVEVLAADVDETIAEPLAPDQVVETLALRKAHAVFLLKEEKGLNGVIIGSDTIVVFEGRVLGKPKDDAEARDMLQALQGRTHQVFSGVSCIDTASGMQRTSHRMTKVHMKALSAGQIDRYIATGEPADKAGAYAIQGIGATIVEGIEGDYFNVVGLPLSLLSDMLADFGFQTL
ncbi:Maf family protein [Ferviditalea candida]|uniref:dTTP/UTP pyrophosphatase n=1 Tax=Ferviditalea candida TaxID=3108399 RepID=A0ABU5ZH04_9BACL|nr:Maf family protein [Paenibacillaceae bacterium T2]